MHFAFYMFVYIVLSMSDNSSSAVFSKLNTERNASESTEDPTDVRNTSSAPFSNALQCMFDVHRNCAR